MFCLCSDMAGSGLDSVLTHRGHRWPCLCPTGARPDQLSQVSSSLTKALCVICLKSYMTKKVVDVAFRPAPKSAHSATNETEKWLLL